MRRLFRRLIVPVLAASLAASVASSPASGDFASAELLSGTKQLQFAEADSPALSQDGRYVAFRGLLAGVSGVYRRDLQTGEVVPVAVANTSVTALSAPDSAAPSISADGRYVAFTSAAVLDPAQDTGSGCPQVYVRDMDIPAGDPGAYTLASAVNGGNAGLTYAVNCASSSSEELAFGGSQAAAGVALSADGRQVVFTVLDASDLASPSGAPETPGRQVAVRDLSKQTTTLVSVTPSGEPTPGGGAYPSFESEPEAGQSIRLEPPSDQPIASSAAISADGTTVAWEGTNVPEQVPSATDVVTGIPQPDGAAREVEPLWRRIGEGSSAITRRLLNEAGLNFYFFRNTRIENSGSVLGGAFVTDSEREFVPPALSEDGYTVAVVANAPTPAGESDYLHNPASRGNSNSIPPTDAYVVRVPQAATEPVQIRALTATPSFSAPNVRETGVRALTISHDGSRVAFNTVRTSFALSEPLLISPPTEEVNYAYTYEVNLKLNTLQRVTDSYDGASPNGEAGLLAFSGDGRLLAFGSEASDLFYGDGAPGASEVYLTQEVESQGQPPQQIVSPAPLLAPPAPLWVLDATASAQSDGSALVLANVPGAGHLGVRALAQLPASTQHRSVKRKATKAIEATKGIKARRAPELLTRTVARAAAQADGTTELRLRVRPPAAYRALVDSRTGLYTFLSLTFIAPGHAPLLVQIPVTLRSIARARTRSSVKKRVTHARRPGRRQ